MAGGLLPVYGVPDGSYLSSFGQAGGGPGEFAGGELTLFVDSGDSLRGFVPLVRILSRASVCP